MKCKFKVMKENKMNLKSSNKHFISTIKCKKDKTMLKTAGRNLLKVELITSSVFCVHLFLNMFLDII